MRPCRMILAAVSTVAVLVGGAACGGTAGGGQAAATPLPSPTPAPVVKAATATVAGVAKTILTDPSGMTLYWETTDAGGKVSCTGPCAVNWPPLIAPVGVTKLTGGPGVTGTLATVTNPDGKMQITYNRWPLYAYSKDKAPGDTTGQGVANRWAVVTPDLAAG